MANGKHTYGSDGGGTVSITVPSGVTTNTTVTLQDKNGTVSRLEDNGGRKNYLINGNFNVAQRGSTHNVTTTFSYGIDRFRARTSTGTTTINQFSTNAPSVHTESLGKNYAVIMSNSNGTIYFGQPIENVRNCAGKIVTLSFNGSVYNGTAKTVRVYLYQYFGSGGTPSAQVTVGYKDIVIQSNSLDVAQKYTATFLVPSIDGKTLGTNGDSQLIVEFELPSTTSGFTYDIGNIKLEDGTVATDGWHPYDGEFGSEVQACERYYRQFTYIGGSHSFANSHVFSVPELLNMRVIPTLTNAASGAGSGAFISTLGSAAAITYISANSCTANGNVITANVSGNINNGVGAVSVHGTASAEL